MREVGDLTQAALHHKRRPLHGDPQRGRRSLPGRSGTASISGMAVPIRPRELPTVFLSGELGNNAGRVAAKTGLVRAARGVFTRLPDDDSPWQRADHLARARVAGLLRQSTRRVVFSHRTAALIHGLWLVDRDIRVHTTQHKKPSRVTPGIRRHVRRLDAGDLTEVNGLLTTTIERTVVDCAKTMRPKDALVVADSGMRALVAPRRDTPRRNAEATKLRSRLLAMVEQGDRRNRRQARAVINHADPLSESPYETVIRWIAVSRGLPRPTLQPRYEIDGYVHYPDMRWRLSVTEYGKLVATITVLGEYDGEIKYVPDLPDGADARRRLSQRVMAERRRQNRLAAEPNTTIERFDRTDLSNEDAVFRRLCAPFPAGWVAKLKPVPELLGQTPAR